MGLLGNFGTSLTLLLVHLSLFRAHREHKVHNIVLYPDKESWCKTTPIKQVVTWPQCSSQELDNNVCVGACFSYMVPHSEPSAPGDLIRPYCDSCQPLDSIWHTVTLECKDKDDNPTTMQKKVQIITNCSCSSCMESSRIKPDLNNLLQSLELESARIDAGQHHQNQAQQASLLPSYNHHHHHHIHHQSSQPVEEIQQQQQQQQQQQIQDQQQQQSEGTTAPEPGAPMAPVASEAPVETAPTPAQSATGGNQSEPLGITAQVLAPVPEAPAHEAPDLLLNPNLNGSSKGPASPSATATKAHERFFQLFKQLNDPNLADDKLKKLAKLASLEKLEKLEKLASEYAGAQELLEKVSELLHKYSSQDDQTGSEATDEEDEEIGPQQSETNLGVGGGSGSNDDEQLLQLLLSSSTTLAPAAAAGLPELKKDEDDEEVPSLQDQQLRVAASLLHRTGPHHSLVLDSGVKEKIDVESHYLQPALAGQEISYHDNVLHDKASHKKDF